MAVTILKTDIHGDNLIWYNPNDRPQQKNYETSSQYLIDLGTWESELKQIPFSSSQDAQFIYDYGAKILGYYPLNYQIISAYKLELKKGLEVDCVRIDRDFKGENYNRIVAHYEPKIYTRVYPESFDDIFKKYREYTNNEDAYSFKEWLKENYEYALPKKQLINGKN